MRLEFKYLAPNDILSTLREELRPVFRIDDYTEARQVREYTVRSIYFDTLDLDYYNEKKEGIKIRKKLRVRGYNNLVNESVVFLEIKKKFEKYVSKNRSPLLQSDLEQLFNSKDIDRFVLTNNGYIDSISDAKRFFYHYLKKSLQPLLLVVYEREAFFSKFDPSLRITFDKNLRYMAFPTLEDLYSDHNLKYAMNSNFILEVKCKRGFSNWLRAIITKHDLPRLSLSKYAICLDSEKSLSDFHPRKILSLTGSIRRRSEQMNRGVI